jgi:hypothetical protein
MDCRVKPGNDVGNGAMSAEHSLAAAETPLAIDVAGYLMR